MENADNFDKTQAARAWKQLYRFSDNVKTVMDIKYDSKNGDIEAKDVNDIVNYYINGISGILRAINNTKQNT